MVAAIHICTVAFDALSSVDDAFAGLQRPFGGVDPSVAFQFVRVCSTFEMEELVERSADCCTRCTLEWVTEWLVRAEVKFDAW
jgi:hypothetical protein